MQWRKNGRPRDREDPIVIEKISARTELQKLIREEEAFKQNKLHNELMETDRENIGDVPKKLKKIRGEQPRPPISHIETLVGTFENDNVLEGFRANAEKLCSKRDDPSFCNDFYKKTELEF